MTAGNAVRQARSVARGVDDVLDQLTIAHAENFDRHGPLVGLDTPAPLDAVAFAVQQDQRAHAIDDAQDADDKTGALLTREAARHEQVGRLASSLAGYALAHGDPADADPMKELGREHFVIAAELRQQVKRDDFGERLAQIERDGGPEALIQAFKDGGTPWGEADEAHLVAPGIYSISTGRHGGYYLSPERHNEMPEQLKQVSFTKDRFFEEDCASCAVHLMYPDLTTATRAETLEVYNAYFGDELGPLDVASLPPEGVTYSADRGGDLADFKPAEARATVANQNDRDRGDPGRGL